MQDGSASYADTVKRLRSAQKKSAGAPVYSLYVNRPLGRLIAAAAYRWGLTPNQVTAISALFSLVGIVVLALGSSSTWSALVVGGCLVLGYAFDSADGQLARLRGGGSVSGEWLDHVVDSIKIVCLHLAVFLGATAQPAVRDSALVLIPLAFTAIASVMFFGMILNEQLRRAHRTPGAAAATSGGRSSLAFSVLKAPTDYGILCLCFFALGFYPLFFGLYTLLGAGCGLYLLVVLPKWFRDMRALDAQNAAEKAAAAQQGLDVLR